MPLNYSNFKKNLENYFFYEKKTKIAVGVSGGPDSLALAMLFHQWSKKQKGKLVVLIIDHKI